MKLFNFGLSYMCVALCGSGYVVIVFSKLFSGFVLYTAYGLLLLAFINLLQY